MTKLVKARWVAGYHAERPDKTALVPGVTVCEIPAGEAEQSDHWQPVTEATKTPKADS